MTLIVGDTGREFEPAPEGLHTAVCCDVRDLGEVASQWGPRPMIEIRWQIDAVMDDGKPFMVIKRFTKSLHIKSSLRPFLEGWRGRKFTEVELRGFDLEKLLGVNCQLQVIHTKMADGRIFGNAQTVVPPLKGSDPLLIRDYTRVSERTEAPASTEDEATF